MPELPEIECLARAIRPVLVGQTISSFRAFRRDIRIPIPIEKINLNIVGQRVASVDRRSKYLLIKTDKNVLAIHLGMSGEIGRAHV